MDPITLPCFHCSSVSNMFFIFGRTNKANTIIVTMIWMTLISRFWVGGENGLGGGGSWNKIRVSQGTMSDGGG